MNNVWQSSCLRLALAAVCVMAATTSLSYPGKHHELFTFLAAQRYNQCASSVGLQPLTPLEIRYIAKANSQEADRGIWDRLTKRDYFEMEGQERGGLTGFMETRMTEHFDRLIREMKQAESPREEFRWLGRVVHYIQKLSSPAHVVPIRVTRILRAQFVDRFDRHLVNRDSVIQALGTGCDFVIASFSENDATYLSLLVRTAEETRASILQPIPGLPITWEAFWTFGQPGSFGSYGAAGNNFGRHTEFRCDRETRQRCLLLQDDPIYLNFATERHVQAIKATVHALLLSQSDATDSEPPEPDAGSS